MADRIAVITGAGSGIGKFSTLALLNDGWSVVLAGRRAERLDEVIAEADAADRTLGVPTDVADPASVSALFAAAVDRFGRVDLVFNNAGRGAPGCRSKNSPSSNGGPSSTSTCPGPFTALRKRSWS